MSAPLAAELFRLPGPVDADHEPEAAGPAGLHAGQRVLEHCRLARSDAEAPGGEQEHVGRRLAGQVLPFGGEPVDDHLEQLGQPGHLEHRPGVGARRHHGSAEPGVAYRLSRNGPTPGRPRPRRPSWPARVRSCGSRGRGRWRSAGGSVGCALGKGDAPGGEEGANAVGPLLAVDVAACSRRRCRRARRVRPVSSARRRRNSSNISFQAAAWTVAVRVSTPSRSNRQARMPVRKTEHSCLLPVHGACAYRSYREDIGLLPSTMVTLARASAVLAALALVVIGRAHAGGPRPSRPPPTPFRSGSSATPATTPQGERNFLRIRDSANAAGLAFVVHDGDIWMGGTACNDDRLRRVKAQFNGFRTLIYTPGDNEWQDCPQSRRGGWRPSAGCSSPRRHRSAPTRSRSAARPRCRRTPAGSGAASSSPRSTCPGPSGGGPTLSADLAWLDKTFDRAEAIKAPAVMIIWQDDPTDGSSPALVARLKKRAAAFRQARPAGPRRHPPLQARQPLEGRPEPHPAGDVPDLHAGVGQGDREPGRPGGVHRCPSARLTAAETTKRAVAVRAMVPPAAMSKAADRHRPARRSAPRGRRPRSSSGRPGRSTAGRPGPARSAAPRPGACRRPARTRRAPP